MGRWSQYDNDSHRLPEGVTRIAYDADSRQYVFRDNESRVWLGAPGEEYGHMSPVKSPVTPTRPIFEDENRLSVDTSAQADSFHDFLSPDLITSPAASPISPAERDSSSLPRLVSAVKRATVPRMQGVVHSVMRRSATLGYRRQQPETDEDEDSLLPSSPTDQHSEITDKTVDGAHSICGNSVVISSDHHGRSSSWAGFSDASDYS